MEILSINSWWEGMSIIAKIYWMVTIPSSLIFLIQSAMTFIGADSDSGSFDAVGNADVSIDSDSGIGFQLISFKNFIAFFTIFGWSGLACVDSGLSSIVVVAISVLSGLVMMVIMTSIYYFMGKLTESGNLVMGKIIGKTGTVYLVIPAARKATGKVQVQHQGFQTIEAMTDEEADIPTGSVIQVTGIINENLVLVQRIK